MGSHQESILIFTVDEGVIAPPEVSRGLGDVVKVAGAKASEVTVGLLQENMIRFLNSLNAILRASPNEIGGLTIDEVEVNAQIDGRGNVGISGIAGTEFAAGGGIKFVLRRKA